MTSITYRRYRAAVLCSSLMLLIVVVLAGCQKERLEGEGAILIGDWRCTAVIRYDFFSSENTVDTVVLFDESTIDLHITLTKRGRICLYENSKRIGSSRIEEWSMSEEGNITYYLTCPNLEELIEYGNGFALTFKAEDNEEMPFSTFRVANLLFLGDLGLADNQQLFYYFTRVD